MSVAMVNSALEGQKWARTCTEVGSSSKVNDFDVAARCNQDVVRLDISMYNACKTTTAC